MSEIDYELQHAIINDVLNKTHSYIETVIAYFISVYIDIHLGTDTVDIPEKQYKEITSTVMKTIETLGLNNSDSAKQFINEELLIIHTNLLETC